MFYAVSAHTNLLHFNEFSACFVHFSHLFSFFPYNLFNCMIRVNTKFIVVFWLWNYGSFTISLDVSEESEYDLWSDHYGSWIGRSSKSRSPDSMKHLRYDRKSSSGYFFQVVHCSFDLFCCFYYPNYARIFTFVFVFVLSQITTTFVCCARLGGVSSASPDLYEATGRRSSSGKD